ncbi:ParA family protein [Micrococcus luteus]|uniref:ParA family protein n=1 Tax=Micrococcus luteus TaxID=1270 RepID=UPI003331490A
MAINGAPLWLIAMLKGGARKSTTAMMLAFSLASKGEEVLVVDADHGTQGVTDWASKVYARDSELPFDVVQWSPRLGLLVPFIKTQQKETGAGRIIVDVGGEAPEVLRQIVIAADRVVSPVGPEEGELSRVAATQSIVGPTGAPMGLLLTRVPSPGVGRAKDARRDLTEDGFHVFTAEIPQSRERYADVWGYVPADCGAYDQLTDELLRQEGDR